MNTRDGITFRDPIWNGEKHLLLADFLSCPISLAPSTFPAVSREFAVVELFPYTISWQPKSSNWQWRRPLLCSMSLPGGVHEEHGRSQEGSTGL